MPKSLILLLLGRVTTAAPCHFSSHDSARPGSSTSALEVLAPGVSSNLFRELIVKFSGTLINAALNDSGFASQRTACGWAVVDLLAYSGLIIDIPYTDGKTYTLNCRDTVPLRIPASGASAPASKCRQSIVRFEDLVLKYRRRVQTDTAHLHLTSIKRENFMIRR
ncbi:putative cia30 family protein [Diplocarpon rosae]|nr:putative cia30 family protein [Diplocarpon rosae]